MSSSALVARVVLVVVPVHLAVPIAFAADSVPAGLIPAAIVSAAPCKYPFLSRVFREQGRTVVRFDVDASGRAHAVEVVSSSGSARLDEAAIGCVKQGAYKPTSAGGQDISRGQALQMTWKLDERLRQFKGYEVIGVLWSDCAKPEPFPRQVTCLRLAMQATRVKEANVANPHAGLIVAMADKLAEQVSRGDLTEADARIQLQQTIADVVARNAR